jgi:protein-disulfide isomerase
MRLNSRTVILLIVSLVVIVAVLLITNPASAPSETATPVAGSGPVFGELDQTTITSITITNNETGEQTVVAKDEGGAWAITDATNSTDRATDHQQVTTALETFAALASSESFSADDLAVYGLDSPDYTLVMTAADGATYTVLVGNQTPANPRYYALINDDPATVYAVQQTQVNQLTNLIATPPYVPPPTATATFTPSPNPYSEVEQTATAVVEQTATTETLFAQLTAESTSEVTAEAEAATEEATQEAAAETTEEAVEIALAETTEEATEEVVIEATAEVTEAMEATEEATAETTEEAVEVTEEVMSTPTRTRAPTSTPSPTETPTPTNTAEPLPTSITVESETRYADIPQGVSDEGFPQLGEPDAPVQLTIYSSFGCPFCREFHLDVFLPLVERVRAGDVLVTFVPLTTANVANAEAAANAAVCAAQQDTFWWIADILFERQGTLRNQAFTSASLSRAASTTGIDTDEWQDCLDSELPGEVLAASQEEADAQSIESTPSVFVNGEAVDANLDSINVAIDAAS